MKKKVLLTVFAVILVLAMALTFTACNKKELKLKNKMDVGDIIAALGKADIKNFTMVATDDDGSVKTTYYTQNGATYIREKDGKINYIIFKLYEDGKYYNFEKDGDDWTQIAYSLGGNEVVKSSVDETQNGIFELFYLLNLVKMYAGKGIDKYYDNATARVENKDRIVIEVDGSKIVCKDFNKTSLYIPDEISNYKSRETTDIGRYVNSYDTDGLEFSEFNISDIELKTYTILSEVGGRPVTAARIDGSAQKIYIPKSVIKVKFGYSAAHAEIHYAGTVEEWKNNVTYGYNQLQENVTIKCSDGEVVVEKGR